MRLLRQLVVVFAVLAVLGGIVLLFSYDVIKLDWISFMEIQPSYRPMEDPRPVPVRSIPIEGAVYIPNSQTLPANPIKANDASLTRGK